MVEWKCCEKCRGTKDNPTICMACPEIKIEAEEKLAVLLDELATQRAVNKEMLSVRIKELEGKLAEKDKMILHQKQMIICLKSGCVGVPNSTFEGPTQDCIPCKRLIRSDAPKEADKPIGIDYPSTNHKWGPFTVWFPDDGRGFGGKLYHHFTH